MIFIDYGPLPPYLRYGVVSPEGEVVHSTPIELPGFRLQHDVGLTQNHALLFDMSMMWDPEELKQGRVRLGFFPERAEPHRRDPALRRRARTCAGSRPSRSSCTTRSRAGRKATRS